MRILPVALLVISASLPAVAQSKADAVVLPPVQRAGSLSVLPEETVSAYMSHVGSKNLYTLYAGQNDALKAAAGDHAPLIVAYNFAIDQVGADTFKEPFQEGGEYVYSASFTSQDACAVRVRIDMSAAADAETVYVIDPTAKRAFGPYRQAGLKWLPTIAGDTAVVVVRTADAAAPRTCVTEMAHFFRGFGQDGEDKALSCEINIGCESNATIQELSSGVGIILIPEGNVTIQGTGSLINEPSTPALEPYMVTANHVLSTAQQAADADIVWDYRSPTCDSTTAPSYNACPHSSGTSLLATDSSLDTTLIQLDTVPVGIWGRAYFGWDNRTPVVGEEIAVIHHPGGTRMRCSRAHVTVVDTTINSNKYTTYYHETRVTYDQGVTEGGSSGSAMLLVSSNYRIAGMLTSGSSHGCIISTSNWDTYSSFRHFLPSISPAYLTGTSSDHTSEPPILTVVSFALNGGSSSTTSTTVTLDNTCSGTPTHYMASESSSFTGAIWLPYDTAPSFVLSSGTGTKNVYFKVKDASDESDAAHDTITLRSGGGCNSGGAGNGVANNGGTMGDLAALFLALAVLFSVRSRVRKA